MSDYGEVFGNPGHRPIDPSKPPRVGKRAPRGRARTLSDFLGNLSTSDLNEALGRSPGPVRTRPVTPPRSSSYRRPDPKPDNASLDSDIETDDPNANPQLNLFPDDEYSQISEPHYIESSRCSSARYHFGDKVLLVSWTNGKTPWMYRGVDKETFFTFLNAPSKGQFINQVLNSYAHGPISAEYAHLV